MEDTGSQLLNLLSDVPSCFNFLINERGIFGIPVIH